MNNTKIIHFLIFCFFLVQRYKKQLSRIGNITRLDAMKMLFFCAVYDKRLLDYFDNFYALPNGPVESNCYAWIYRLVNLFEDEILIELEKGNSFTDFIILLKNKLNNNEWQLGKIDLSTIENSGVTKIIEAAVNSLPELFFRRETGELVEMSHQFSSWINSFGIAEKNGCKAWQMDVELIRNETIITALSVYA